MMIWRTTFYRYNFDYRPHLEQRSDVVFETDIPFNNEGDNPALFEQAAWRAMWEQNPQWKNPKGPLPGDKGWSSVGCGNMFKPVEAR
jgi:hypothetical protein